MNESTNNIAMPSNDAINNIIFDILQGTKSAGSEIYGATKIGIAKSVDFVTEQTPMLVQELADKWKLQEYQTCAKCKKRLVYNDTFVDVAQGVCGTSQGHPCAYVKEPKRYHLACYKKQK